MHRVSCAFTKPQEVKRMQNVATEPPSRLPLQAHHQHDTTSFIAHVTLLGLHGGPRNHLKRIRSYSSNVKSNSFFPSVRQRSFMFTRDSASLQVCSIVLKNDNQLPLPVALDAFAALAAAKPINSSIVHLEACAYTRFCFRASFFKSF